MTDVLDTPPAPTEGEAGPVEGGNGLVDASLSPFDYAGDDEEAAGGPGARAHPVVAERVEPVARAAGAVDRRRSVAASSTSSSTSTPTSILKVNTPTGGDFGAHVWGRPTCGTTSSRTGGSPAGPRTGTAGFPHVPSSTWWCRPWSRCCSTSSSPYGVALKMVSAGAGRPAGVLLGLRQARRSALPDPAAVRHRVDLLPLRLVVHDLRRQRGVDDGGGVLLQPRPVHVDAVPRRARPGACGQGRGGALAAGLFALTVLCHLDRRHLRHGGHPAVVRPLGGPQAHPLPGDDAAGGRPADRLLDACRSLFGGAYMTDMTYERRPVGNACRTGCRTRTGRCSSRTRPGSTSSCSHWRRSASSAGVIRGRRAGVFLGLVAVVFGTWACIWPQEPPVERSAAAVHVPGPLPAGLHRRLRDRLARRPPPPAGSCATAGPHARNEGGSAAGSPDRRPGLTDGAVGRRLRRPRSAWCWPR